MAKRFLTSNDIGVSNRGHHVIDDAIRVGITALDLIEKNIIENVRINVCASAMYFDPDSMIGREAVKK